MDQSANLWHRPRLSLLEDTAMEPVVKITVADYIATVMMDRPPVNAQSDQLRHELIAAFDSFTDRDDVRVAILTGVGKMFSAGADMKSRPTGDTATGDAAGLSTASCVRCSIRSASARSR